jgi:hypothetical protein
MMKVSKKLRMRFDFFGVFASAIFPDFTQRSLPFVKRILLEKLGLSGEVDLTASAATTTAASSVNLRG